MAACFLINDTRSNSDDVFEQTKPRDLNRKRNSLSPVQAERIQAFANNRRHSLSTPVLSPNNLSPNSTLSRLEMVEEKFFQSRKKKSIISNRRKISVRTSLKCITEKSVNVIKTRQHRTESMSHLLKRIVNSIRILCRISYFIRKYAASKNDVHPVARERDYLQCIKEETKKRENTNESQLYFDKTNFIVEEGYKLPFWARMLCSQPPNERKEDELRKFQRYLRGISVFSKFPETTQMELCRNALYGRYDNLRVILNQGHESEFFYIIISGDVAVNVTSYDRNTGIEVARSVDQLRQYDSFGGTGLIYNTKRTASVISASKYVEVILFDKEVFRKYCMLQLKKVHEQQKIFLTTHKVFEQWPEKKLQLLSYDCKSKYYSKGKIIDYDLARSNFIYFVMEGAVDILYYKRDKKPGWLFSEKLKKDVGILGGNKILPPSVCNLPNSLRVDTNVGTILLSCSVTILYLPVSRYNDIKPKQPLLHGLSIDHDSSSFYELDDEKYKREKLRGLKWIEYRSQVANEKVRLHNRATSPRQPTPHDNERQVVKKVSMNWQKINK